MNLTLKLSIDNAGEAHMRSLLTESQPEPAEGQARKVDADWTKTDIEGYLLDRNIDLLGGYFKDQSAKKAAKREAADPTVRAMKKQLDAAPDAVKAQVAALLKDVAVDSGSAGKA